MKDGFQWCPFIELNPIIISMILHDQGRSGLQQVSSRRFSKQGTRYHTSAAYSRQL